MTTYGYARVSTKDQDCSIQRDALEKAGASKIFTEKLSGAKADRPALMELLSLMESGDTLLVFKLDRLGRSLRHLLDTLHDLEERQVTVRFLKDDINTGTSTGRLMLHILGSIAEFERELIIERTAEGVRAAEAMGRKRGRPRRNMESVRIRSALDMYGAGKTVRDIIDVVKCSRATFFEWLSESKAVAARSGGVLPQ